jgi:hypothetical protein
MIRTTGLWNRGLWCLMGILLVTWGELSLSQAPAKATAQPDSKGPEVLKHDFFAVIREGNAEKFLAYVSKDGVNVGSEPQHQSRDEVEQQMREHRGLYCKLFDSSCIDAPIKLDESARPCSYREVLTHSQNAHLAATETVRNRVRQAILLARVNDGQCPGTKLIDFIFNAESEGWKLFSIP